MFTHNLELLRGYMGYVSVMDRYPLPNQEGTWNSTIPWRIRWRLEILVSFIAKIVQEKLVNPEIQRFKNNVPLKLPYVVLGRSVYIYNYTHYIYIYVDVHLHVHAHTYILHYITLHCIALHYVTLHLHYIPYIHYIIYIYTYTHVA